MIVKVGPFCRKGLSLQGEPRVQQATGYRPGILVDMHTSRGRPRSPPRQGGPTEIRDYTRTLIHSSGWLLFGIPYR